MLLVNGAFALLAQFFEDFRVKTEDWNVFGLIVVSVPGVIAADPLFNLTASGLGKVHKSLSSQLPQWH